MRIALTSDTHLFIDKPVNEKRFRRLIKRMLADGYELGVHAGDWNGGKHAWRCIEIQCRIIREEDPTTPWLVTTGNHDVWVRGRWQEGAGWGQTPKPNEAEWQDNRDRIAEIFRKYNMHFIDEAPYRDPRFPGWVIVGEMGWYVSPNPPTNDSNFLPIRIEGRLPHEFLLSEAEKRLAKSLEQLEADEKVVFMSHFPVIAADSEREGYKGSEHDLWNWSQRIGEMLRVHYGCRYFLCGHSHSRHEGPLRYEAGSGVYNSLFGGREGDMQHLIIEVV
jgi:hypothetical protein